MSYPPPGMPYGPPPPQYNPQPAGNRGKTVAVIVVAVVVALLVCVGGTITTLVVLANQDDDPPQASSAGGAPAETGQPDGSGLDCRVVAAPDGKAVGRPTFTRAGNRTVTMTVTTNQGVITIAMDRAKAPCTVASFEYLADQRFFDNSPCHRLTAEGVFVLQCGDPTGTGSGGPDYRFTDENLADARYTRGVVAMANAGPDTNGSQFFILYRDSEIAADYTVFGQVQTGLEIVDRVAAGGVEDDGRGPGDGRPRLAVTVESVTVG